MRWRWDLFTKIPSKCF